MVCGGFDPSFVGCRPPYLSLASSHEVLVFPSARLACCGNMACAVLPISLERVGMGKRSRGWSGFNSLFDEYRQVRTMTPGAFRREIRPVYASTMNTK